MCWKCGKAYEKSVSRSDVCPECGADLHCCKNCTYYAPGSHYDCHETVDENVSDKEKANFCDSFKMKKSFESTASLKDRQEQAKKAFDSLFSI